MADKHPTWIYRADGSAEIVDLANGDAAPKGWSRDPAVIEDDAKRTAEAISGIKAPVATDPAPVVEPGSPDEALRAACERIAALEAIIESGKADNARLDAELKGADEELEAAAAVISAANVDRVSAEDRLAAATVQLSLLSGELAKAKAENQPLHDALVKAQAKVAEQAAALDRSKSRR